MDLLGELLGISLRLQEEVGSSPRYAVSAGMDAEGPLELVDHHRGQREERGHVARTAQIDPADWSLRPSAYQDRARPSQRDPSPPSLRDELGNHVFVEPGEVASHELASGERATGATGRRAFRDHRVFGPKGNVEEARFEFESVDRRRWIAAEHGDELTWMHRLAIRPEHLPEHSTVAGDE